MADRLPYPDHLRRQLGYIGRSVFLYDWGAHDEAIRIAVCVRTLLRNSPRSLLTHLGKPDVLLLTTAAPCPFVPPGHLSTPLIGNRRQFIGMTGSCHHFGFRPAAEWFDQVILVNDDAWITRRDVVDGAADKDGGVHVDSKLSGKYKKANAPVFQTGRITAAGEVVEDDEDDFHFLALRIMAYELLNSPSLLTLCNWREEDAWPAGVSPNAPPQMRPEVGDLRSM